MPATDANADVDAKDEAHADTETDAKVNPDANTDARQHQYQRPTLTHQTPGDDPCIEIDYLQ